MFGPHFRIKDRDSAMSADTPTNDDLLGPARNGDEGAWWPLSSATARGPRCATPGRRFRGTALFGP
jgi:hypothetical protein